MAERRRNSRKQVNLIVQGGIMAVMSLLVNACVLLCRIPLTALWGDEGNGIYAASFGAFSLFWLICAYGLPLALSGLLKTRLKREQYRNAGVVMQSAFWYAVIMGVGLGALLFLGSDFIAVHILSEPLAVLPMRLLAPALFFMALSGVLRGFFLGSGAVFPVLLSFLVEQAAAIAGGILLAHIEQGYGSKVGALLQNESFVRSFAVMGFAGGISAGALLSFLFLLGIYMMSHGYYKKRNGKNAPGRRENMFQACSVFMLSLLPVIFYGVLTRGYVTVQQLCFRLCLGERLDSRAVTGQWGIYDGKYKVLTMLPVILAAAMGVAVRDRVHAMYRKENWSRLRDFSQTVLKAVMVLVFPLSVLVGTLAVPILEACFSGQDTESASVLLLSGFMTSVFFSASYLLAEMLLGMEQKVLVLFCGFVAFSLHIGALYAMLEILDLGLSGVVYADILYGFCLLVLVGTAARKKCGFRHSLLRSMAAPLTASAVMGGILYLLAKGLRDALPTSVLLAVLAASGIVIYTLALLLLRGVSEKELRMIPGGMIVLKVGKALRVL